MVDYVPIPKRKQTREEMKADVELTLWMSEQILEMKKAEMQAAWIPADWEDVERNVDCRTEKTRLTLRVDADVAKFFRKMGPGYQARINAVLRMYFLARKAKLVTGPMDQTITGRPL